MTVDDKTHTGIKSHNGHTLQCNTTGPRNRNVTFRTCTEVIALTWRGGGGTVTFFCITRDFLNVWFTTALCKLSYFYITLHVIITNPLLGNYPHMQKWSVTLTLWPVSKLHRQQSIQRLGFKKLLLLGNGYVGGGGWGVPCVYNHYLYSCACLCVCTTYNRTGSQR